MMEGWIGLVAFGIIVVTIICIVAFMLIAQKRGFQADLAKVILREERRYQRARGVAQDLHRLLGDQERHLHRTVILLTLGDLDKLADYIKSIPQPEHNELRKPIQEASLIEGFQDKVKKLTEGAQDVLGPEGE